MDLDQPAVISPPDNPNEWDAWRTELIQWREKVRTPEFVKQLEASGHGAAASCLICALTMLFDRQLYDEETNSFKVESYVSNFQSQFGRLDAIVLWQAYPRIGIDSRNQYDHYRSAPGLREVIGKLNSLGVRAYLAYNPWDTGTRRENNPDSEMIAQMAKEFGFDGVFLDTLAEGMPALRTALDRVKPAIVMESEDQLPVKGIPFHQASWAQWFEEGQAPGVLRNRWLERSHMMHTIRRWDLDHSGELQMAWMNGVGILVWENVFGSWTGWNDRDKAILRSMMAVRGRFADLFDKGEWEPLVTCSLPNVYASKWTQGGVNLWTLVNREDSPAKGAAFPISADGGIRLFDLIRGIELDHAALEIPGRWIGALLTVPTSQVDASLLAFVKQQAAYYSPGASGLTRVEQVLERRPVVKKPHPTLPTGMIAVTGQGVLVSKLRVRECGDYDTKYLDNSVYPSLHFERITEHHVQVGNFAIDATEVSNREYHEFLQRSGHPQKHPEAFLKHWHEGKPREKDLNDPVIFVSLRDARAYAEWVGKRLPTEFEWQLAAANSSFKFGQIWNWTESEYFDGRTRFSFLKGGCKWKAAGSEWYADSGPHDPDWTTKLIHFWPELDRTETIGFRCVIDLDGQPPF